MKSNSGKEKEYPAVYRESLNYAINHGEADKYHESRKLDRECKGAIERALPYLDDSDMVELSNRIIKKLRNMTDEEFEQLELIEAE